MLLIAYLVSIIMQTFCVVFTGTATIYKCVCVCVCVCDDTEVQMKMNSN